MADEVVSGVINENQYCLLYPSGDTKTFFYIEGEYQIKAVPGKQAYDVAVRVRLGCDGKMTYSSLDTILKISCNNQTVTDIGNPSMSLWVETGGVGPYTDWYHYEYNVSSKQSEINLTVVLDLSKIEGLYNNQSTGLGGPCYVSRPDQHFNKLYASATKIKVDGIVLGRKPSGVSLSNRTNYNNNPAVSHGTDIIRLTCSVTDWGDPAGKLHWSRNSSDGIDASSGSVTKGDMGGSALDFTNLNPGTVYTIKAYVQNSIGKSNTAIITVRTRHHRPEITMKSETPGLEQIDFTWRTFVTVDTERNFAKTLKEFQYRIGTTNGWNVLSVSDLLEGNFTVGGLSPGTTYTIYYRGTSSDVYDGLNSTCYEEEKLKKRTVTTLGISYVSNIVSNIFGETITVEITAPSTNNMSLLMWVTGDNGGYASFTFDNISRTSEKFNYSFTLNQSQLDSVYRCFTNKNYVDMHFILTTIGNSGTRYSSAQYNTTLVLTGIAKTAYVGVNGYARRAQIWVGDANNTPRRAVGWVGVDNNVRRST